MPLFMDFHKIDSDAFTEEEAYKAHLLDVAIQNKYGVVYKRYYLNLSQKAAFCLMEGPNKAACEKSHQEAHGVGACNVIEVSREHEFLPFLGEGTQNKQDLALTRSGDIDSGYRTLLLIDYIDFSGDESPWPRQVTSVINKHGGRLVKLPASNLMGSYVDASDAIRSAMEIRSLFESSKNRIEFSMALATGKPVDENGVDLFAETRKTVNVLLKFSSCERTFIDLATRHAAERGDRKVSIENERITVVDPARFKKLVKLDEILLAHFSDSTYKSEYLGRELSLSKTQCYRRLHSLTGLTPNKLLCEYRLKMALQALKTTDKTVAEIAYDSGFSSPTYFTRVFRNRFNTLPFSYSKSISR